MKMLKAVLFLLCWEALCHGHIVKLVRHNSAMKQWIEAKEKITNNFSKYGNFSSVVPTHIGREALRSVFFGMEVIGDVAIGTPPQRFKVIFDIHFPYLWVPSHQCTETACSKHNKYNSAASSTHVKNGGMFNGSYGTGFISEDVVSIGGLESKNQLFAEITHVRDGKVYATEKYDGIFGLGFPDQKNVGVTSVFEQMYKQGAVAKNQFSFYLNSNHDQSYGGELYLGGADRKRFSGNFDFHKNVGKGAWVIEMSSLSVGGRSGIKTCAEPCYVFLNTAFCWIYGPKHVVSRINEAIGAHRGELLCSNVARFPNITITFSGKNYVLTPHQYVLKIRSRCFSMLFGHDFHNSGGHIWMFGTSFMEKYYTTFDLTNRRVGFATLAKDSVQQSSL